MLLKLLDLVCSVLNRSCKHSQRPWRCMSSCASKCEGWITRKSTRLAVPCFGAPQALRGFLHLSAQHNVVLCHDHIQRFGMQEKTSEVASVGVVSLVVVSEVPSGLDGGQ